ncbi:neutral zinc metallopeptidase [Saccharomonospora sp. NPDC046836]|uniref:KPN_02809 family neutral zinc metallopeptidase n=1 Tax=Saccharomonospora sp. NPDC046836 TaxID=3156921 RepID=UPI0033EDC2E4
MRFNDNAGLDASEVRDLRGSGGGGVGGRVVLGGGGLGLVGVLVYVLLAQFGGISTGPLGLGDAGSDQQVNSGALADSCRTGADANNDHDCAVVAIVNSIQDYWTGQFTRTGRTYHESTTTFFNGGVGTGCGSATSDVGPFYCPADSGVYIDLTFFDELRQRFGATGGLFSEAYVLAHEYGHHVQNLLGTSARVRGGAGPESDGVRLELQADCYAGVWANHATTTPTENGMPLITDVTEEDIAGALDTAGRIGDDFIQRELGGGTVDESTFTHGTSAQRERWFRTGYTTGDPARCNTFRTAELG